MVKKLTLVELEKRKKSLNLTKKRYEKLATSGGRKIKTDQYEALYAKTIAQIKEVDKIWYRSRMQKERSN